MEIHPRKVPPPQHIKPVERTSPEKKHPIEGGDSVPSTETPNSKDATGELGQRLDLVSDPANLSPPTQSQEPRSNKKIEEGWETRSTAPLTDFEA